MKDLLIFDMDGVLVDVTDSYRETIRRTVEHFTGTVPSDAVIQSFKNAGGWNDDFLLTTRLILDAGGNESLETVVEYFDSIFHGPEGLIQKERWNAEAGLFERLAERNTLSVFTGRMNWEAQVTLDRFAPGRFEFVIGADHVQKQKPDPEGIFTLRERIPHDRVFFMGDTADDALAGRDAGVRFVGVLGPRTPNRGEAVVALKSLGAVRVVESINELEGVMQEL